MAIPLSLITAIANMAGDAVSNTGNFVKNKSLERRKNNLESYMNIAKGREADYWMNEKLNANKQLGLANLFAEGGETQSGSMNADAITGLIAAIRGLDQSVGTTLGNDYHSSVGDVVNGIPLMSTLGGAINRVAGVKTRQDELLREQQESNYLANTANRAAIATSFDDQSLNGPTGVNTHVNPYKAMNHTSAVLGSTLLAGPLAGIGASIFNRKAHDKAAKQNEMLSSKLKQEYDFTQRSTANAIDNIKHKQINGLMANMNAYGGPLDYDYNMTQLGILGDALSPLQNRFAFGGGMPDVNTIGEGGTHEENPNGGVPMGVDNNGIPNLVEEGEVTYDNYVFSNRLTVPKAMCKKLNIKEGITFAEAAEKISAEAKERSDNDPIANAGKETQLKDLIAAQEVVNNLNKAAKSQQNFRDISEKPANEFSFGGPIDVQFDPNKYVYNEGEYNPSYVDYIAPNIDQALVPNKLNTPFSEQPGIPQIDVPKQGFAASKEESLVSKDIDKVDLLPTNMRYASAVGPALGLGLASLPETYNNPRILENMAKIAGRYTPTAYTPAGQKLEYQPTPLDYITSQIEAAGAANAKSILASSNLNPASATSALLANAYNTQKALADATMKADEVNFEKKKAVADFNRKTDALNAEGIMTAAAANQKAEAGVKSLMAGLYGEAAKMRQEMDAAKTMAQSSNLTSIFNNIGGIGKENMMMNMINTSPSNLYSITSDGNIVFKKSAFNADGTLKPETIDALIKAREDKSKNKKGK